MNTVDIKYILQQFDFMEVKVKNILLKRVLKKCLFSKIKFLDLVKLTNKRRH